MLSDLIIFYFFIDNYVKKYIRGITTFSITSYVRSGWGLRDFKIVHAKENLKNYKTFIKIKNKSSHVLSGSLSPSRPEL